MRQGGGRRKEGELAEGSKRNGAVVPYGCTYFIIKSYHWLALLFLCYYPGKKWFIGSLHLGSR